MPVTYNTDLTVRIFDTFYDLDLVVDASQYEIVLSYFSSLTSDRDVAETYSQILFAISTSTGQYVLDLLEEFKAIPDLLTVSATMAYYLNVYGSKYMLNGVSNTSVPSEWYQRNVIG